MYLALGQAILLICIAVCCLEKIPHYFYIVIELLFRGVPAIFSNF